MGVVPGSSSGAREMLRRHSAYEVALGKNVFVRRITLVERMESGIELARHCVDFTHPVCTASAEKSSITSHDVRHRNGHLVASYTVPRVA